MHLGSLGRAGPAPSASPVWDHAYAQLPHAPLDERQQQAVPVHPSQSHPPLPVLASSTTMNASIPYAHYSQQQRAQYEQHQVQPYTRGTHDPRPPAQQQQPQPQPPPGVIHGYQTGTQGLQHVVAQKIPPSSTAERTIGPSGRALVFPLRPLPPPLRKKSTEDGRLNGAECYQHGSNSLEYMGVARGNNVPRLVESKASGLKIEHYLPAARGTGSVAATQCSVVLHPHTSTPPLAEARERMLVANHRDARHLSPRVSFESMAVCAHFFDLRAVNGLSYALLHR